MCQQLFGHWSDMYRCKVASCVSLLHWHKGKFSQTSRKRSDIVPSVLALHAFTGCDSVTETCGIGKTSPHTRSNWSVDDRSHPRGQTVNWFHGCKLWLQSSMLFLDGMPPAAVGTESMKVNSSTKTVCFATNNWSIWANAYRAHFWVAQWYTALSGDPATLNDVDYRSEPDEANSLIPRNMAE